MYPRARKYFERKKAAAADGSKKGSANLEGYNEETPLNRREPKENPAPSAHAEYEQSEAEANGNSDTQEEKQERQQSTEETFSPKEEEEGGTSTGAQDYPGNPAKPGQDDTGGENNSGQRQDPH